MNLDWRSSSDQLPTTQSHLAMHRKFFFADRKRIVSLIVLLVFTVNTGCDNIQFNKSAARKPRKSKLQSELVGGGNQKHKMTVAEIKQAVREVREELPFQVHDDISLEKVTCDYNGATVTCWLLVQDIELVRKLQRIGWEQVSKRARERLEDMNIDLEELDGSEKFKELLIQDELSIQYIFEDKYQSHLGSVAINKSAIEGEERIGKTQENPFAVRNVSAEGGDSDRAEVAEN